MDRAAVCNNNYFEAALRLFKTDAAAAGVPLRLKEIVAKAFPQVGQVNEAIKRLRWMLDEDARTAPPPASGK